MILADATPRIRYSKPAGLVGATAATCFARLKSSGTATYKSVLRCDGVFTPLFVPNSATVGYSAIWVTGGAKVTPNFSYASGGSFTLATRYESGTGIWARINGANQSATACSGPIASTANDLCVFNNESLNESGQGFAIADLAFWSAALTDAECASLEAGMSPKRIRPESLIFHAPLIRELGDRMGTALVSSQNVSATPHPRVYP